MSLLYGENTELFVRKHRKDPYFMLTFRQNGNGVLVVVFIAVILKLVSGLTAPAPPKPPELSLLSDYRIAYWDINTSDSLSLLRVPGIGPGLTARILAYRRENGCFSQLTDLMQIHGIKQLTFNKLAPFLRIDNPELCLQNRAHSDSGFAIQPKSKSSKGSTKSKSSKKPLPLGTIDINECSEQQLATLPKIGPTLAKRIILYRKQLGFFTTITQLQEIPYISGKTYQSIVPYIAVGSPPASAELISVRSASLEKLTAHPYIGHDLAKKWIEVQSTDILTDSASFCKALQLTPDNFRKLSPYIRFD